MCSSMTGGSARVGPRRMASSKVMSPLYWASLYGCSRAMSSGTSGSIPMEVRQRVAAEHDGPPAGALDGAAGGFPQRRHLLQRGAGGEVGGVVGRKGYDGDVP